MTTSAPVIFLEIILLLLCLIILRRLRRKNGILAPEYPHEVIFIGILAGFLLSGSFLFVHRELRSNPQEVVPWSVIATAFAAPISLIMLYWKHLQGLDQSIVEYGKLLGEKEHFDLLTGLLYLERLARSNIYIAPTIIELICGHLRMTSEYRGDKGQIVKFEIDILSRIWNYHSSLWNSRHNLEPDLRCCDFSELEMWRVCFKGMFLEKANFSHSYLRGAILRCSILWHATLIQVDLSDADLHDAQLHGANLSGCIGLSQKQLESVKGNQATILPHGLAQPESWISWCEKNSSSCFLRKDCRLSKNCGSTNEPNKDIELTEDINSSGRQNGKEVE